MLKSFWQIPVRDCLEHDFKPVKMKVMTVCTLCGCVQEATARVDAFELPELIRLNEVMIAGNEKDKRHASERILLISSTTSDHAKSRKYWDIVEHAEELKKSLDNLLCIR